MTWIVEFALPEAEAEIEALPTDMQAKFFRFVDIVQAYGLVRLNEPFVKHIEGKLWEIRLKGKDGIARTFYVAKHPKRVVVLRTFIKKTQKTPRREIKLAYKRAEMLK